MLNINQILSYVTRTPKTLFFVIPPQNLNLNAMLLMQKTHFLWEERQPSPLYKPQKKALNTYTSPYLVRNSQLEQTTKPFIEQAWQQQQQA